MKVVKDEVASHANPNGPPLNANARMAVVPRFRRKVAFFNACCEGKTLSSVVWVMVSSTDRSQKSLWAGIGT